jgi:hypothetical protein
VVRRHKPALLFGISSDYDHRMHAAPWSAGRVRRPRAHRPRGSRAFSRRTGRRESSSARTVFVVSDHGFAEVRRRVSLYALLNALGLRRDLPRPRGLERVRLKVAGGSAAFYLRPGLRRAGGRSLPRRLRPRLEEQAGGGCAGSRPCRRARSADSRARSSRCASDRVRIHGAPDRSRRCSSMPGPTAGSRPVSRRAGDERDLHREREWGAARGSDRAHVDADVGPTIAVLPGRASLPQATGRGPLGEFRARSFPGRSSSR